MPLATVRKRYRDKEHTKFMGWQADYVDQNKKRHARLFNLKKEADAWLDTVKVEVSTGTHTPARESITVSQACDLWLEYCKAAGKRRTSTLTQYGNHCRIHIVPAIGGVKLSALSGPMIEEFKDKLLTNGSRAMAQKVMVSLKAVLSNAKRLGKVATNHAADVKLPPPGTADRRQPPKIGKTIPTKDELKAILDQIEGTRWHPLVMTAALAGLRSSELRALRWVNVHIEDGKPASIHVVERADEKNKIAAPKSDAGTREIPIPSLLANTLRRWRDGDNNTQSVRCPSVERVFPTGNGKIESHGNIAHRGWYAPQIKAGVLRQKEDDDWNLLFDDDSKPVMGARYGFHSLRHFAASLWVEHHEPKRVQELMGHASITMTMDLYAALFPAGDGEREKMEKAVGFLAPVKAA